MKTPHILLLLAFAIPLLAAPQNTSSSASEKDVAAVLQNLKRVLKPGVKGDVFQKLRNEPWYEENCEITVLHGFAGALDFELRSDGTLACIDVIPGEENRYVYFQIQGDVGEEELRRGSILIKDQVITGVSFPSE